MDAYRKLDVSTTTKMVLDERVSMSPKIYICHDQQTLADFFVIAKDRCVTRMLLVESGDRPGEIKDRLKAVISLSDIMKRIIDLHEPTAHLDIPPKV